MTREANLAWCAGFFDGEGCVRYYRQYPNKNGTVSANLMCSVSQNSTNREVLDLFQTIVGLGEVKGPYATKKGKTKHLLSFSKIEVSPLFALIGPYLQRAKTEDFHRAIRGYEMHDPTSTEEDFERLLRKLDKKRRMSSK